MILCDKHLKIWAENGGVTPYDEHLVNPASIDLRLGPTYRVPVKTGQTYSWSDERYIPLSGLVISPHAFVLCRSLEITVIPKDCAAKLFLKSTSGRGGLEHLHTGYRDPGFSGSWTFELTSLWPGCLRVFPQERLFQLTLETLSDNPEKNYEQTGRYCGQIEVTTARPPRPS